MLNLDKVTSEERVSQLRELTPEALAKISVFPSRPFVDQEICFMAPSYKCIEGGIPASLHPGWCEDIFIGDCEYDVSFILILLVSPEMGAALLD